VIRAGRLQQVADPTTLYHRPANRFVAGLIGSPAMNFFEGRIERRDDRLVFEGEGFFLPIPESYRARLESFAGQPITLGIRPEHIGSTAAQQRPDAPQIAAKVEAVEPLGAESYVYYKVATQTLVSRGQPDRNLRIGDQASLAVADDHLHFFDPQTQKAVTY
jgi:multiple sugar transport system ATP-binding protein